MYFVNHEKQILVFWFHKCGHTSLINFFNSIGNFTLYEAWNQLDSYSFIEEYKPELLKYRKCMITRNPIHYSISGFKHFFEARQNESRIKKFLDNILIERYSNAQYTLDRHLEILLSPDILFHADKHSSTEFFTHCCRKQSYTLRPDVKVIHLEEIFLLPKYLSNKGIHVTCSIPHSNKRDNNIELNITKKTVNYWTMLYKNEFEELGYNLNDTIRTLVK